MFRTTRKLAIVLTSAAALVALASPAAFADAGDTLLPANTTFTVSNSTPVTLSGTVTVGFIPVTVTVTCPVNDVTLTAMTGPASPGSLTATVTVDPTFTHCTDNQGGTDTVTTSGSWTLTNNDVGDPVAEPQASGDELVLGIPSGGAKFFSSALSGCTITANASTPTTSSFNDGSGTGASSTSGTFTKAPVSVTGSGGCSASSSALSGTFQSATAIHDTA
jgi:hypothetical protein